MGRIKFLKSIYLYFVLIVVCSSSLYGNFQVSYFDSKQNFKDINLVINKEFIPMPSKKTFGKKKHLWLKVSIENSSDKKKKNYTSINNLQIMEDVHFYTIKNNELVKQNLSFNKYRSVDVEHRIGNVLFYGNEIEAKSKLDVYIYITAKSNIYFELNNGSLVEIMSKVSRSLIVLMILLGALVALAIYYMFLWMFTPNKEYLYYTLLVLSIVFWAFYVYGGYAYYLDIFKAGVFSNTFVLLIPIFTILFFQSIYKDNEKFKKYHKVLTVLVFLMLPVLVAYLLGNIGILPYISIATVGPILYLICFLTILVIAISIYIKKLPYSGLFLLAYSMNFVGSFLSISFFMGKVPYNTFTLYGNVLGGVLEAILFSLLLTYKTRQLYKEKEDAVYVTKVQNVKMNIMSETIDFISHQWRQPLSQINSSIMVIDDIAHKNKIKIRELDEQLLYIEDITQYMSTTIDDFRNLFSMNKKEEFFLLNALIPNIALVISKTLETHGIKLEIEQGDDIYIEANKGDISQTLMVLINNAIDALMLKKVESPIIKINLSSSDNKVLIEVYDNAGGIETSQKKRIFDAYYTTKDKTKNSGLGLYIAKVIVETKMKGSLFVKDTKEGNCFCIEFEKVKSAE